jgi:hypothetical protein
MKSAITYSSKQKFYRPNLFLGAKIPFKSEYHWTKNGYEQRGHYQSEKCTVIVSIMVGWLKDNPEFISMQCDYRGYSYYRNYNQLLSEHSLKLACAKFCKDIINNNI